MALHHFAISLCDTQIDATKTSTTTRQKHALPFFEDRLPQEFHFPVSRKQDDQFVLCRFVVVVIVIFCAFKSSNNHKQSPQVGPRPLDQAAVSNVLQRSQLRCWACPDATGCSTSSLVCPRSTTTRLVAELQRLHHQCLHPQSRFQQHDLQLSFWR